MGEDVLQFASPRKKTRREERRSMGSRHYQPRWTLQHNGRTKGASLPTHELDDVHCRYERFLLNGTQLGWSYLRTGIAAWDNTWIGALLVFILFERWASLFLLGVGCSTLPGEALYSSSLAVLLVSWNGPGGKRGKKGRFDSSS